MGASPFERLSARGKPDYLPTARQRSGRSEHHGGRHRQTDRRPYLEHAQRLEDPDHDGGVRPRLPHRAGEYRPGRPDGAGFPEDLAEQQDPGHRRPRGARRRAYHDLRVGRDPAISRAQDRLPLPGRGAGPHAGGSVAVLAGRRARADAGAGPPFPHLRAGEDPLRHRALHHGIEPALQGARHAPRGRRIRGRRLFHRRHRLPDLGQVHQKQGVDVGALPNVARWLAAVLARPAVQRGLAAI